jgi:ABC-type nitrate/sulfonate/bicarbonate transport system substrate-binding protein
MTLFVTQVCAETIRTAIPQANLNYLSIYVAEAKGFFRDEDLEHETVVISGPLATAALLSGDVTSAGAAAAACGRRSKARRSRAFFSKQKK